MSDSRGAYLPGRTITLDPFGAVYAAPGEGPPSVSGVVGTNADLMEHVASRWVTPNDVVVDATYGRGVFWRNLDQPTHRYDIAQDGVCLTRLPHGDRSVDVVVLDPPYRPSHGSKGGTAHGLGECYGVGLPALDSMSDVLGLYDGGVTEAWRVLAPGGRLIVKCQDMSYNHRLHLVTIEVLVLAQDRGFHVADHFVLVNTSRPPARGKQERARRSHSVMWVFVKPVGSAPSVPEN